MSELSARSGLAPEDVRDHYSTPSACLYATYDEVVSVLHSDYAHAFERSPSWDEGFRLGVTQMLSWLADRPAAARLVFIEVLRGDRELLRHRELARRRLLELLIGEHRRRGDSEDMHEIQLELMLGAVFQLVASHVANGRVDELPAFSGELIELAGMFEPVAA